ncbi:MAG: peptidase MA family metallohydrolase [Anaerolineales bacterium]|nr:peptidase MA family metallohydrolase [Anaerolineales bacterium]
MPELNTSVEIEFGESIRFATTIEGEEPPIRAVLFIRSGQNTQFKTRIAEIKTTNPPHAIVEVEPMAINLVPFAQIEYYWQVDLADGVIITSETERMNYHDQRFEWQDFARGSIAAHWVDGDLAWGQNLLAIAESVLPEMRALFGTAADTPIHIYVYPDQSTLQNSLRQAGINQVAAHALPETGAVLLSGKSGSETLIHLEQDIPHELVHVLLHERMRAKKENLPVWLDEGLATHFEQTPRPIYRTALEDAAERDALLAMESLCASFPIAEDEKILAYAQSASFTNYLLDIYGSGGILLLLDAYEEGVSCTGGIQRVYRRSLGQLESEWKGSAFGGANFKRRIDREILLTIGITVLILALGVSKWLIRKRRPQSPSL